MLESESCGKVFPRNLARHVHARLSPCGYRQYVLYITTEIEKTEERVRVVHVPLGFWRYEIAKLQMSQSILVHVSHYVLEDSLLQ